MDEDQSQQPVVKEPTEGGLDVPEAKKEKGSLGNWIILIISSVIVAALVYIV